MSNENNNQFNNEVRENHEGQSGYKRPYKKNYKFKPQHRNSHGRKPMQDRKAPADKEKSGKPVPFKDSVKNEVHLLNVNEQVSAGDIEEEKDNNPYFNSSASGVQEGIKYCRNCGNRLPKSAKFCDKCGTMMDY